MTREQMLDEAVRRAKRDPHWLHVLFHGVVTSTLVLIIRHEFKQLQG